MEDKQKIHLVNWELVTRTKDEGRLGLARMKERNEALLAKLNWRLWTEKEKD